MLFPRLVVLPAASQGSGRCSCRSEGCRVRAMSSEWSPASRPSPVWFMPLSRIGSPLFGSTRTLLRSRCRGSRRPSTRAQRCRWRRSLAPLATSSGSLRRRPPVRPPPPPSPSAPAAKAGSFRVEPQGGPNEREILLRLATVAGGGALSADAAVRELEAVSGVTAVELGRQTGEGGGISIREVKVFYDTQRPVCLEDLQVAATKGGADGAEVIDVSHALEGVRFGEIAEHIHGEVSQIVLMVNGLRSKRCAAVVAQSLETVKGVSSVSVVGPEPSGVCPTERAPGDAAPEDDPQRKVLVTLERGSDVTPDMLRDAVERWAPHCCGRVQPVVPGASQVLLRLSGVDTTDKARALSAAVAQVPGVVFESISIADQEALVIGNPSFAMLIEAVRSEGYRAEVTQLVSKPIPPPRRDPSLQAVPSAQGGLKKATLRIGGMTCSSCSSTVEHAVGALAGVHSVKVNLLTEKATVEYDPSAISAESIAEEVEDVGFEASVQDDEGGHQEPKVATARIIIGDMSCSSCANSVEAVLRSQAGVSSAAVNFAIGKATVTFDSSKVGLRSLVEAVEAAGYSAAPETWDLGGGETARKGLSESQKWAVYFAWALVCALPIASITMGLKHLHVGDSVLTAAIFSGFSVENAICLVLATASQFGPPGLKFYKDSFHGVMRCAPNMALLVSLGTTVSFIYGAYGILSALRSGDALRWPDDYFEVSADLIAFITLGKWLEARAKGATSRVLHKLLELKPQTATLLTVDDEGQVTREREIPAEQLQVGDLLKVVRGSSVPADGVVVVGTAEVDESMLTGESMPVVKTVDDKILGATVVREGTVFLRVTSTGTDTVLSQIVRMIEDAQASKPPIQAMADAVSRVFVPAIVATSAAVFAGWLLAAELGAVPQDWMGERTPLAFALNMGIATMVVACPCAMGLAVPTAIMVGTGVAARNGVLIKEGEAIEHARKVTAVIFDKTGTLTEGKPRVTDVCGFDHKVPLDEIVRLVGAAETNSEHPLGRAIVAYAEERARRARAGVGRDDGDVRLGTPTGFLAESGKGLQCKVDGRHIAVGTRAWMLEMKAKGFSDRVQSVVERLEGEGKTAVLAAVDLEVAAVLAVADAPRPESADVLRKLNSMKISTWMVTGDNQRTASSIAESLGISKDCVMAEVLPGNKARKVSSLQEAGQVVAMVGDGINDAPALAQADLGIAVGNGTDIAIEAASMVLMGGQITSIVAAIDVSRAIYRRIWINFGWAFVYNLVLIPAAAGAAFPLIGATLPAWAAGAAMAMSSVSVVVSSLLLNVYTPPLLARPSPRRGASPVKALDQVVVEGAAGELSRPLLQSSD
uniref:P-type Cu(+) transporter n=2 Tax=Tetraselmis sp. GSL018 TaxID=582737 RepID=A0A061RQH4_9CHLO